MDPGELRRIAILADLPDERLAELARHGTELTLAGGEYLFREGEEATFLSLLLDGELETTRSVGGDALPLLHHEPGGFLGAISLVTGAVYGGSTRSVGVSRLFLLEPEAFRGLLVSEPAIFTAVMDVFVPVITNYTAIERDRDRLLSLGTLAAGLAHELNNPAAAAQRGASELRSAERDAQTALSRLASSGLDADGMSRLCTLTAEALERGRDRRPARRPRSCGPRERAGQLARGPRRQRTELPQARSSMRVSTKPGWKVCSPSRQASRIRSSAGLHPASSRRASPASSRTRPGASRGSSNRCGSTPISTRRSARRSTSTMASRARS